MSTLRSYERSRIPSTQVQVSQEWLDTHNTKDLARYYFRTIDDDMELLPLGENHLIGLIQSLVGIVDPLARFLGMDAPLITEAEMISSDYEGEI